MTAHRTAMSGTAPYAPPPPTASSPIPSGPPSPAESSQQRASPPKATPTDAAGSPYATQTTTSTSSPPRSEATSRRRRNWNDYRRVNKELVAIETELGLFRAERGDHTAAKRPTRAEKEKATRWGHQLTARERLRGHVRAALAGAASEDEFFARLAEEGVRVKMRIAPSGDPIGYSVAIVGDRNADRDPIWFSGAKLAPDLSFPRIRQRLTASNLPHDEVTGTAPTPQRGPSYARRNAVATATQALDLLNGDDEGAAAAQLVGTGELLDALAKTSAAQTRTELHEAARSFERATRSHIHAQRTHYRALRKPPATSSAPAPPSAEARTAPPAQ